MDNKLKEMLEQFDKNQIRQINSFLNSRDGMNFKNSISRSDKEKLLKKFSDLDKDAVREAVSRLSANDISGIIGKFKK